MVDPTDFKGIVDPKTVSGDKKSTEFKGFPDLSATFQSLVQAGLKTTEAALSVAPKAVQMTSMDVQGWQRAVAFGIEAFNANMSPEAFNKGIETISQSLTQRKPGGPGMMS